MIRQIFTNIDEYVLTPANQYLPVVNGMFMNFDGVYGPAEKGDIVFIDPSSRFRMVLKKGGKL